VAAPEDSDRSFVCFRIVTGMLECTPAGLEKESVLGIHEFRLAAVDPEKSSVEAVRVIQYRLSGNIPFRVRHPAAVDARASELLIRKEPHGLDAAPQIRPELVHSRRTRKARRNADDRNELGELVLIQTFDTH